MNPYYEQDGITIYHGDCRDVLPTLDPVSATITDPPYGVNIAHWDAEVPHDLLPHLLALTSGAVLWFGGPHLARDILGFATPPPRVAVWAPSFKLGQRFGHGMFYRWHAIYCWQMPNKHDGPKWDILTDPCDGRNPWKHPGTKPLSLMRKLVGFCPASETLLDPFLGSGTTLVAAREMGRKAIGIEIEEQYCEVAAKRLEAAHQLPILDA